MAWKIWRSKFVVKKLKNRSGQSTVEFAIIALVLMIIIAALSFFSEKVEAGIFMNHAISAASHNVVDSISGLADAFSF